MSDKRPGNRSIGVFDSGVGGLTVLKAVHDRMPGESLLYLGDTARLPYGTKSRQSILRYAMKASTHLQERNIKLLVVACNTASAVALPELQTALAPLPVIGVIEPGARAAVAGLPGGRHLVLATEATVSLGAYSCAIRRLDGAASVDELACELLVALAEEGWTDGEVAEKIIHKYLDPLLNQSQSSRPQSLILGCTHFPILRRAIRAVAGQSIAIVDSAVTTANVVEHYLRANNACCETERGTLELLATDGAGRFARVGGSFLGTSLDAADIELVDL